MAGRLRLRPAPSPAALVDTRKLLDRVAARAGWKPGEIRTKMFCHTSAATRRQTLHNGASGSLYTFSRELGHNSLTMVEKVYAHLGTMRHPSEVVEDCHEQQADRLRPRLEKLGLL